MNDPTNSHRPAKVLIVDDEEKNRRLLETLLRTSDYDVRCAVDGVEAIQAVSEYNPDLILLDVMMPRLNGFEAARELKRNPGTKTIPIIMLTSLDDRASRLHGLAAGVEEFLTKPVERTELLVRVRNLLRIKSYNDLLVLHNRILEERVKDRTSQLRDSYREAIYVMTAAIEYADESTGTHVRRVSDYTSEIARQIGLGEEYGETIFFASPMHDIGKIGVPQHVLLKPGPLTDAEWEIVKTHTLLGERILKGGQSPYLRMAAEIAASHHEHWDGTGYPRGLRKEAIPLAARIMHLCDQYDALRSPRPYKGPLSHARTVEILTQGDGRTLPEHFDPAVLTTFIQIQDIFNDIFESSEKNKAPANTPPGENATNNEKIEIDRG